MKCVSIFVGLCLLLPYSSVGETYSTAKSVVETLSDFYYNNGKSLTKIIPLQDLSQPIGLTLTMALYSIDKFDAVTGQVEITGSLFQEWTDETRESSVGGFNFTGIQEGYSVLISPNTIWTPSVVLLNAVDTIERVGDPAYKVRYQVYDGRSKWQPRTLLKAACTPDIRYYPFDRQECSFTYTPWGYTSSEVNLESAQSDWYLCDYTQNGVWTLIETSATQEETNGVQQITFTFKIERRPLFFVINVVFPALLLGFVNGFVFLMPPDCGERIGFSITCFLTLVFMLQTVLAFLPHAADPMSIFFFYIVVMMIMSIGVAIVTVIVLRIHHIKDSKSVPSAMKKFIRIITFVQFKVWWSRLVAWWNSCRRKTANVIDTENGPDKAHRTPEQSSEETKWKRITPELVINGGKPMDSDVEKYDVCDLTEQCPENPEQSSEETARKRMTPGLVINNGEPMISDVEKDDVDGSDDIEWPDVSRILDFFFFVVFLATQATLAVIFLVPLATGAK